MCLAVSDTGFELLNYLEKFWLGFQVVFGIGLMIFIHELGHFMAAKKIGVRVDAFSLGFGPRIWGFTRGGTEYRLAVIPLGGYVKMAGEEPDDAKSDSPDELQNRTAFERMIIFGAGVFMNFLFAFITIPIIFNIGVPFVKAEVGTVATGGPAWRAELETGDKILEVNGNTVYEFTDIPLNIALGSGERDTLLIERNGQKILKEVCPEKNQDQGRYQIKVSAPTEHRVSVEPDTPAHKAGLKDDDRILSINGIPVEEWFNKGDGFNSLDPMLLKVARSEAYKIGVDEDDDYSVIDIKIQPEEVISDDVHLIGIQQRRNHVIALRGALADVDNKIKEGDFLLKVNGVDIYSGEDFNQAINLHKDQPIRIVVERSGKELEIVYEPTWREDLKNNMAVVGNLDSNSVALLEEGALHSLNDPDMNKGLTILEINGIAIESFKRITEVVQDAPSKEFKLRIAIPEKEVIKNIEVTALPRRDVLIGFNLLPVYQIRKLNLVDSVKAGFNSAVYMIKTCYLTLSRIFTGDVGSKNIGGIITIGQASYNFAKLGVARLFFFLAILSINLGVLNLLPIPILDGGHLFFLLIEQIKGSPVNDKVLGYSQVVGLAMILLLLIYVTWNDILRLIN